GDLNIAETAGGRNAGHGAELAVFDREPAERADIDIANTIAIGRHEKIGGHIWATARDPLARLRCLAGFGENDRALRPRRFTQRFDVLFVAIDVEAKVAIHQPLVEEIVFDLPPKVAER